MNTIEVPTFLWNGDELTEVAFTTWEETRPAEWNLTEPLAFDKLSGNMDRVVFEFPWGCRQVRVSAAKGEAINFINSPTWRSREACGRSVTAVLEEKAVQSDWVSEALERMAQTMLETADTLRHLLDETFDRELD